MKRDSERKGLESCVIIMMGMTTTCMCISVCSLCCIEFVYVCCILNMHICTCTYICIYRSICLGREWRWMTPALELTTSLLHVSVVCVTGLLDFRFIFQSEPRVPSFQMGIVILCGIHKKWWVLERFHRNTQIISSVRFCGKEVFSLRPQ